MTVTGHDNRGTLSFTPGRRDRVREHRHHL
jgi:hypothetical protein